jgi:hypothetical protein
MGRLRFGKHSLFRGVSRLTFASTTTAVCLAIPAQAGSVADDANFLAALDKAGISYDSPAQATAAGDAVCQLMAEGRSGTEVIWQLVMSNQGLSTGSAARFASVAASVYCPQYLKNVITTDAR